MKYLCLTVSITENNKKFAYPLKLPASSNLAHLVRDIPHAEIIQTAPSLKQARETAERWNAIYKANGVYMFDTPTF